MGKLNQGILGGYSGKVGKTIGTSWKGIAIIKAMPLSVSQPVTVKKTNARLTMQVAVKVMKLMLIDVIKPLLDKNSKKESGFNRFYRINSNIFGPTGLRLDRKMTIAIGELPVNESNFNAIVNENYTIDLTWDDTSLINLGNADDILHGVIIQEEEQGIITINPIKKRSDKALTIDIPNDLTLDTNYRIYLAFKSSDGLVTSDTFYLFAYLDV
jgi:hypothetical protein